MELRSFHKKIISKDDLCFDIGANVGHRSRIYLSLGARVYALEPQPSTFALLQQRFKSNKVFLALPKAVGSKAGWADLLICESFSELSSLSPDFVHKHMEKAGHQYGKKISVEVITLDFLIKEYGRPKYIKIDVEGYEAEVLEGLSTPIPIISFEFFREMQENILLCFKHLSTLGKYECNFIAFEKMEYVLSNWVSVEFFLNNVEVLIPKSIHSGEFFVRLVAEKN